jgi:Ca2+:H+ antiporter
MATFHAVMSEVRSGILLVAGFGLLFYSALIGAAVTKPGDSKHHQFTNEKLQRDVLRISQITSILLIIAFVILVVCIFLLTSTGLIVFPIYMVQCALSTLHI